MTTATPQIIQSRAMAYRPDVDGLRAVAVIAVVLFHGFPLMLPGGFIGVDIFFVISGFLITRQILASLEAGSFSIADFYYRRIQRIFPALLIVQVAALAFGLVFLFSVELQALAKDLLASVAFFSNIYYWISGGYFEQDSALRILLHLWSLGVEEQYYLVWPIIVALFWRRPRGLIAVVSLLSLLSLVLNLYESPKHPNASFYLPVTRFWELAGGAMTCLIGQSTLRLRAPGTAVVTLLSSVGAFAIVVGFLFIDERQIYPGWRAMVPTLGTALIIFAGEKSWLNRRFLAHPGMVGIGLISYPLYLWHWPLIVGGRILTVGASSSFVTITAMVVSLVLATLTYRFVDRPLRISGSSLGARRVRSIFLLTCLIVVGALSASILAGSGFPIRFPNADALQYEQRDFKVNEVCKQKFPSAEFCLGPEAPAAASIALVGDSHALHLYSGLIAALPDGEKAVLAVGAGNCPPFQGVDIRIGLTVKSCSTLFNSAIDNILRDNAIRTVIVSSYAISTISGGLDYQSGDSIRLVRRGSSAVEPSQTIYLEGLERLFDAAAKAGKRVAFVFDTPELDFDPLSCLPRPITGVPSGFTCSVGRAKVDARQGLLRQKIRQLIANRPGVTPLDPLDVLCDSTNCAVAHDGHLLYRDRDHLSEYGSSYLMSRILKFRANELD
jgi:peptidoglycan/LPS O-acetylase OafA/YrhL